MHTFRLAPIFREGRAPLRPLAGGEGGTRRGSDGRVRWAAPLFGTRRSPTSPQPSPPHRRRGGYFGHLSGCEICACPSAFAGVTVIVYDGIVAPYRLTRCAFFPRSQN